MVVSAIGERLCERLAQPTAVPWSTYRAVPPNATAAAAGRGQAEAAPPVIVLVVVLFNGGPPFRG